MTTYYKFGAIVLFLGLMLSLAACGGGPRGAVYVRTPPPPPVAERVVVSPGPGYVWVPGYHAWDGNAYVWRPGRWDRLPPGRRAWVPGHWVHTRRGWRWVEGHWR